MSNEDLKRRLTLTDAISIVAGSMIGCAIFIVTAQISKEVNNAWLVLFVWILAGIITIFGSLCYGELASGIPDEGGQYIYLKKIFNERTAFTYGTTLLLIIQTGTIAAVSTAFAKFAGLIFPYISETNILLNLGFTELSSVRLLAVLTIMLITFINSRGIGYGVFTQNLFTVTKILSLVLIIGFGLFMGLNFDTIISNFSFDFSSAISGLKSFSVIHIVATALVGALFASITWNNVTFIAGEVKSPEKNIPRAMIIGSGLVIALYILTNFIYLGSLSLTEIQNSMNDIVAAELTNKIFSQTGLTLIAIVIMISAFGCINGMTLTGSRVYYKMAKDRLLFRPLAQINRHTKVPVNSLWLQCGWICLLILLGTYSKLLDFVIYSSLIFYIITITGMWFYRKNSEYNPTFKVNQICIWGFVICSSIIVLCLSIYKKGSTLPGLLIILIAYLTYPLWKKK
ncbi:amino acid permease [bacterium]|nr:amino acid permease [bacterium]